MPQQWLHTQSRTGSRTANRASVARAQIGKLLVRGFLLGVNLAHVRRSSISSRAAGLAYTEALNAHDAIDCVLATMKA